MSRQVFKSKVDASLAILLLVAMAVVVGVATLVASQVTHATAIILVMVIVPLVVGVGLPLWMLLGTSYIVDQSKLAVRCGPLTRVVPLAAITRVVASRSIMSAPALSLDRLMIEYGKGQQVTISPRDKAEFIRALVEAGAKVQPGAA